MLNIKRIKSKVALVATCLNEAIALNKAGGINIPRFYPTINVVGREVVISNGHVLIMASIPSTVMGIMAFKEYNGNTSVVCNTAFTLLPKEIQEAFVMHEIGHLELKHMDRFKVTKSSIPQKIRNIKRGFGDPIQLQMEFEADEYSHRAGYDMIGGLRYIRELGLFNDVELNKRITRLCNL